MIYRNPLKSLVTPKSVTIRKNISQSFYQNLVVAVLVQESRSIQTIEKSDFFKKSDFLDF